MGDDNLVPLFTPALGALLLRAEDLKGSPLGEAEVIRIRDEAAVIMMTREDAAAMAESRGEDIDPENCWYDWQMLRRELGRKPDIDPGARFSYVASGDEAYRKTILDAQDTLGEFRKLAEVKRGAGVYAQVKTLLEEPGYRAFMWLIVRADESAGFLAEIIELPGNFTQFTIGQQIRVNDADVMDWMILEHGTLHGGYSLRYSRDKLDEAGKAKFDEHVGVRVYA